MKTNRIIQAIMAAGRAACVPIFLLLGTVTASAQWAGPDQEVLKNQQNTQTVTLSVTPVDPNACYKWTGPNIQGDANQPSVVANPQDSIQTYICKRISQNGVEEDDVKVKVIDSVKIVSVKPKKECYQAGEPVTTDQFDIVTEPKGYENQVTVQPTVMGSNNAGLPKEKVPLTFSLTVLGGTSTKTAEVNLINNDLEASVSMDPRFGTLYKKLQAYKNCSTLLNNMAKKGLATGKFPGMKQSNPSIQGQMTTPTIGFHFACCNEKEIGLANFHWGGFSLSAGIGADFPFYIPAVPGLNIYVSLSLSIGVNLGEVNIDVSLEEGCSTATIGISGGVTAGGAVGVSFVNPKILGAQLGIEGSATTGVKWDILKDKFESDPITLKVALVGKVTFLSMEVCSGSWTLGQIQF